MYNDLILKGPAHRGDKLSSKAYNALRNGTLSILNSSAGQQGRWFFDGTSVHFMSSSSEESTGSTALKLCRITGHAGVAAPWRYSGIEVDHDGTPYFDETDNFDAVVDGDTISGKLLNLQEIGPMGIGVNCIPDDSIVAYWAVGTYYFCSVSNYKGTY